MAIIISEANPSGSTRSYAADWFEVTNTGSAAVDITGWKIDDNSHVLANAVALRGITSIAAGQSIVFIENSSTTVTDATVLASFQTSWFGANVPANFTFGFYGGAGVGLSGTADEVNLFDTAGNWVTGIGFGAATPGVAATTTAAVIPGQTFDNNAGISLSALAAPTPLVTVLSAVGTKGAFLAADGTDIGSPGKIASAVAPANPSVNLSVSSNAGSEAAPTAITVTATATSAVSGNQTINLAVSGTNITTGDYTLSSPTLTILSGQTAGTATFTVVDDTLVEGSETATLALSSPSAGISLGTTTTQNIVITDNDTAPKNTTIDLSTYVQVGRYDLPEPSQPGTVTPANSLLAQEVSAVTYNWDTDTLFVVGDGSTSIVQVDKQGKLIDSMTLALGASPQGTAFFDLEGLTYVGGGKFVFTEERYRQVDLFTYKPNTTLNLADVKVAKLGTEVGNIGLEGVTYDPLTNSATTGTGFVLVKEKQPEGIFQTNIDFATGKATNGSPTTVNSTDLFDPLKLGLADFADVYALSTLTSQNGGPVDSNLLVLSQESGKVLNIDRSGNILSSLTIDPNANGLTTPLSLSKPLPAISVVDQQQEGITLDKNGFLYITSENGGGDITRPQLWVYAPTGGSTPNQAPTAVILNNPVKTIAQSTSTTAAVKVADIAITDDGKGTNTLTLSGADAGSFEITGNSLFLKARTALNATTKASYNVSVNVDDPTVGNTPDATTAFTLGVTNAVSAAPSVIVSEVAPWSSSNSPVGADWFEITNTGSSTLNIAGWKIDDNSNAFSSAVNLNDITSIGAGESVIFIETTTTNTPEIVKAAFKSLWFGTNAPATLQIGTYTGSGVGLSTAGDAVNIFDASGNLVTGISFGASPAAAPFGTFVNQAGLGSTTLPLPIISTVSVAGVNGAFVAPTDATEIGSPGKLGAVIAAKNVAPTAVELSSTIEAIVEKTSTTSPVKVGDIAIVDDGQGTNNLTLTGADASFFEITGTGLFIKAGTNLDSALKTSYNITVNVDDPTVGNTPDASAAYSLTVIKPAAQPPSVTISEVDPQGSVNAGYGADWFEITNTGTSAVDITGWKIDDDSNSFAIAASLKGLTSIPAGKSAIFIETPTADSATIATYIANFSKTWFGSTTVPTNVLIGTYTGAGVGLSGAGDSVNIFDASGKRLTGISFGSVAVGPTIDNKAGLGSSTLPFPTVSTISSVGVNGAFLASDSSETGSPANYVLPVLSVVPTTNATETSSTPGVFTFTSDTKVASPLTFSYTVSGTATSGTDYGALTGSVTIAAGQTSVDIPLVPVDDQLAEGNETVTLTLGKGKGYTADATESNATITIIDNEPAPVGTSGNDTLIATPGTKFDGQSSLVFTGAGNDEVDLSISTVASNNRINLGSGPDTIFVSKNDRVFGGAGNDIFDATDGKGGNRMSGGAGDDLFFLGKGDRALGGDGNDKFYVQSGGDNLLSGGAGNDQFWVVNGEVASGSNTVLDFQIGTDVVGFFGATSLGISATTLKLNQVGDDTTIVFGSQTLATLTGIQASSLSLTNANQFVFA